MDKVYTIPDGREFMLFENVESLLEVLREISSASTPEARVREGHIFRGHGDSRWLLEPNLFRRLNTPKDLEERTRYTDAFIRDLHLERTKLGVPGDDLISLLAIAQHYGFPTAMLDFSYSFEVAAAFACNDPNRSEYGVVYEMSLRSLQDLVNPFGAVGFSKDATDAILAKVELPLIPPAEIVSLPTVKRVTAQEGLFFKLEPSQVHALERDCIDRYYFKQTSERNKTLEMLYSSIFPDDDLLDTFVENWKRQNAVTSRYGNAD